MDMSLPAGSGDKRVLRLAAQRLGLAGGSVLEKRAIQFGSRVAKECNQPKAKGDTKFVTTSDLPREAPKQTEKKVKKVRLYRKGSQYPGPKPAADRRLLLPEDEDEDAVSPLESPPSLGRGLIPRINSDVEAFYRVNTPAAPEIAPLTPRRGVGAPSLEMREAEERKLWPWWVDSTSSCLSGGLAGCVSMAAIYPLDTVKTRMQLGQPILPQGLSRIQTIQSLYSGLPLGLLETTSVHGGSFFFYALWMALWRRLQQGGGRPGKGGTEAEEAEETEALIPVGQHLALSCASALLTMWFTMPLKVLLTRVQAGKAAGLIDALEQVFTAPGGGWRELFAGMGASFWISANPALTFVFFERIRACLKRWWGVQEAALCVTPESTKANEARKTRVDLTAGFVAKALTTGLTFPILKLQAVSMAQGSSEHSMMELLRSAVREHGFGSLYTGLLPKLLQASLQQALIFRLKEQWHPRVARALVAYAAARGR